MSDIYERDAQAARLVEFISAYTPVRTTNVNHEIAIHLEDPARASDIACLLGLLTTTDYPNCPRPFTLHAGRIDDTNVVLFGSLLVDEMRVAPMTTSTCAVCGKGIVWTPGSWESTVHSNPTVCMGAPSMAHTPREMAVAS